MLPRGTRVSHPFAFGFCYNLIIIQHASILIMMTLSSRPTKPSRAHTKGSCMQLCIYSCSFYSSAPKESSPPDLYKNAFPLPSYPPTQYPQQHNETAPFYKPTIQKPNLSKQAFTLTLPSSDSLPSQELPIQLIIDDAHPPKLPPSPPSHLDIHPPTTNPLRSHRQTPPQLRHGNRPT